MTHVIFRSRDLHYRALNRALNTIIPFSPQGPPGNPLNVVQLWIKPRLHERFFACDGDAIFLKIVASPARGENRMCSHPRTGDATDEKAQEKKSREIQ